LFATTTTRNEILFLQVELQAQSVGYFLNSPLKADRVAGRRETNAANRKHDLCGCGHVHRLCQAQ